MGFVGNNSISEVDFLGQISCADLASMISDLSAVKTNINNDVSALNNTLRTASNTAHLGAGGLRDQRNGLNNALTIIDAEIARLSGMDCDENNLDECLCKEKGRVWDERTKCDPLCKNSRLPQVAGLGGGAIGAGIAVTYGLSGLATGGLTFLLGVGAWGGTEAWCSQKTCCPKS